MASQQVISALESLHRELEKLEPAIKHVETAQQVTEIVKVIPQKHIELLKEVKANDANHKDELKGIFIKELAVITEENKKLVETTTEIQKQVKEEQVALGKLKDMVQAFHERVERINFPERLDKVDANVAGIMAAVQSVQSRLDNLERNIIDRLKDAGERQKEALATVQQATETSAKRQQVLTYITWALVVVSIILSMLI